MKSRKVKAAARSKAYIKKLKSTIPLNEEENSYDEDEKDSSDEETMHKEDSSSEEEVLPIDGEEDSSEEEAQDEEESDEDEGLPDVNNWGKKKSTYYNADFVDKDWGKTYKEKELEEENDERIAASLQQEELEKYESSAYLEDYDRAAGLISKKSKSRVGEAEIEDVDVLDAERLKHESKKFPTVVECTEQLKEKFAEVKDRLTPLLELSEKINLDEKFVHFLKLKYQVILHYMMNAHFYLHMKEQGDVPENHPIYKRIEQFKELDGKLNCHKTFLKEMDKILKMLEVNGGELPESLISNFAKSSKKREEQNPKKKVKKNKASENDDCGTSGVEEMEQEFDPEYGTEEVGDEKRAITYQIAKNKGLVARRKKEARNPRVHNRMKYRKAKIRRKGQVRGVIKELKRYGGEPTGISAHVVRSVKIK